MTTLHLNSAVYDPTGYVTLAWDYVYFFGDRGFVVQIELNGKSTDFKVLDPRAKSVVMPYEGALDNLHATLFRLGQDYVRNDASKSNTLTVTVGTDSGNHPVAPMPNSPLSTGATDIIVDAARLFGTRPTDVSWLAGPDDHVSAANGSQKTTDDGKAKFRVNVTRKLDDAVASLLTISVWNPAKSDEGHQALLYKVLRAGLFVSQSRSYGVVADPDNYPYSVDNDDQNIALTALVCDADDGTPFRNYKLEWFSHSGVARYVYYPDGSDVELGEDGRYITHTNTAGRVVLLFGASKASIGEMGIYWKNNTNVRPQMLAFTSMGQDWVDPQMEPPDVPSTPVNLDHYRDDKGVPISLVYEPAYTWMTESAFAGILINDTMLEPELLGDGFLATPMYIPKQYFQIGDNTIGICVADSIGSNGHDSFLSDFEVVGKLPVDKPSTPSGTFKAVFLEGRQEIVNADLIRGGLRINIPQSIYMNSGDKVTTTLYLSAYFPGTDEPKVRTINVSDVRTIQDVDLNQGCFVMVSEDLLANYAADTDGRPGTMLVQYCINSKGTASYSDVASFRLVTV
ncbi:hypothetical protein [Pandoraea sputorum]|uniref:Uncharacterized protein n=1 Tax=Pandoraea sputorum TaxID=93222 RepID=A0A5E5AT48_9BURK|nr:hypothetical protein [Pandoraea sputorum]VVE75765.1 hypothetical protein PSP31121_00594 [Pandoraea sputorum]